MLLQIEIVYKRVSLFSNRLIDTLVSILKIAVASKHKARNLPIITHKRCVILGNGPSLKESLTKHLETLKTVDLVCVNNFACSDYFELLKPQNYVLLDDYYFLYDTNTVEPPESIITTLEKFKHIYWPINFFLPTKAKNCFLVKNVLSTNKNISIYYFNYVVTEGFTNFKHMVFTYKIGAPQCQNVLGISIFLSINRGYEEIYLVGADHSWSENISVKNNRIFLGDVHFYDQDPVKPAHLKDRQGKARKISELFFSFYKCFRTYEVLKIYADSRNVQIVNASEESYIDAFERRKL